MPTPLGDITSLYRSTTGPRDTLGRRYKPTSFPNRAARHPRATLQPQNVPQQFCATPSGNALPLFRRWRVRIEAVLNKPGDSFSTLGRRFKPTSFHNRAMRHSRATLQPLNVPQQFCATPLGNITASKCSPTEPRDTLGQRYSPLNVPQQFCAAPSGNTLPLFRRWRVRIDPVSNKLGDTFSALGRHYKPISFHNRAARHSRATLLPLNVPQQFCAAPSGNTLPLFRRWRVRIEAVLNKPGDSFSTLGRRFKPTSFHNRAARHFRATYSPKVFPNSAMRHSRATLCHFFVAETYALIPS